MKFYCNCGFHTFVIDFDNKDKFGKKLDLIYFLIYEHRSGNTGKLYKKPKLLADVVLTLKESKKLRKFLKKNILNKGERKHV